MFFCNDLGGDEVGKKSAASASVSFDGEGTDSRLARRKRNWIAHVAVSEGRTEPRVR